MKYFKQTIPFELYLTSYKVNITYTNHLMCIINDNKIVFCIVKPGQCNESHLTPTNTDHLKHVV